MARYCLFASPFAGTPLPSRLRNLIVACFYLPSHATQLTRLTRRCTRTVVSLTLPARAIRITCMRYQNGTPADTPLDSPRSGSDSDAAYDSLRGVLRKVSLGKYFKEFRLREVRMEDLQHLTEADLAEVS